MTYTCKITLKWTLKFKILQLIEFIVETDNNDICVRDAEIQIQKVHFRIAGTDVTVSTSCLEGPNSYSWSVMNSKGTMKHCVWKRAKLSYL